MPSVMAINPFNDKAQNNAMNYKIALCKNWEKDKTCKYGNKCIFAHGEAELRKKEDNIKNINPTMPMIMMMDQNGNPIMLPAQPGMEFNQMPIQMMPANFDPNQMMQGMMPPIANFPQGGNMEMGNNTGASGNNDRNQQ